MNDKLQEQLTELAKRLGTTGEHMWSVVVRQAPIASTIYFLWLALTIAVSVGFAWKAWHNKDRWGYVWGGASILVACIGLFELSDLNQALAGYYNPEYWALHDILDSLNGD